MSAKVDKPSSTVAASHAAAIGSPSWFDHTPDKQERRIAHVAGDRDGLVAREPIQDLVGDPLEHRVLRAEVVDLGPGGARVAAVARWFTASSSDWVAVSRVGRQP